MRNIVVAGLAAVAVACGSSAPTPEGLKIAIVDTNAGLAADARVSVLDATGRPKTDFRGTVHLSSDDPRASLPADYQFTAADAGSHSFPVVFLTAGTRALTAATTGGGSATVQVVVQPGSATLLAVSSAPTTSWCATSPVAVTAKDAYGNVATGYRGTVHFVSDDPAAVLPADYTFLSADAGQHAFQVGLRTGGPRTIAVTDGAAAITGSAVSRASSWCPIGPDRGDIQALAADPANPWIVYASAVGAGIFKTIDGGGSWAPANEGLGTADIESIVVDPSSPLTVYAAGHPGIYKSTDGGATWSARHGADVAALVLDPSSPEVLFAATSGRSIDSGVLRSTDGGATWTSLHTGLPDPSPGMAALAIDPAAPSVLYAAFNDSTVYTTRDGGESWSLLAGPFASDNVRSLAVDSRSVVFLGAASQSYMSTDRGSTWTGLPIAQFTDLMRIDPRSPSVVYGVGGQSIFKTADSGTTWSVFHLPYVTAVVADPLGGVVLAGTFDRGVLQSTDRLATWLPANRGLHASGVQAIALARGSSPKIFAASLLGFSVSSDGGASWNQTSTAFNADSLAVDPRSPNIVYAAGTNGAWKSTDSGTTWVAMTTPSGALTSVVIAPDDPSTVYFGTQGSGVFKSTDGGLTVAPTALSGWFIWSLAVDPNVPGTLYATATLGKVFKTSDAGATWSALPGLLEETSPVPVTVLPDSTVVVAYTAAVFSSHDRGDSFTTARGLPAFFFSRALAADPLVPGTVYFASTSGFFKSVDGGASFSASGAALHATPGMSGLAASGNTVYVTHGGGGILENISGGD